MDPLEFVGPYVDRAIDWYKNGDFTVSQMYLVLITFLLLVLPVMIFYFERRAETSSSPVDLPPPTEIVSLYVYPIKSCRGIKLKRTRILKTGLDLDRQWMFVDAEKHEFLTIRQISQMTLINTTLSDKDELVITIKGKKTELKVPAHPTEDWLKQNTKLVDCTVWKSHVDGWEYDPALMKPFSEFFGQEVRLLRKGPTPRVLSGNGAPSILGREETVGFVDLMPVLLASESSMAQLNEELAKEGERPMTIERFRPNIIVKGHAPWIEDNWKTVRLIYPGSDYDEKEIKWLTLDVLCHCARCQVPNVDPDTAEKNKKQPWDKLMSYRRIDEGSKYKPCFGMLCASRHEGPIEVGMTLLVTEVTKKHVYIKGM